MIGSLTVMRKGANYFLLSALFILVSCQADSCGTNSSTTATAPSPEIFSQPPNTRESLDNTETKLNVPQVLETTPLFLTIESPASPELVVNNPTLSIVGLTRLDALLTVGEDIVEPGLDGQFAHTITLEPGHNLIEILASTSTGQQKSAILAVIYVQ